uniref:Glycosyl transferase n=1 Tax=uncultured Alphaproteobacteria bacterium TaxID=91750 RepID=A0A6G8F355_9PROT|nr:glycosyl transferase [uncultured Alphaproteobacteria bacterium]
MVKGKEEKPVVLQVLPELQHGGVEWGTIQVAEALKQNGYTNFVASCGGRLVYELDKMKIKHFTLPLKTKNPVKLYLNSLKLAKIIKENGINIVHARSRAPAWSAYWAAKRAGVKYMTTFHGTYGLGPKGIKKFYNKVMTFGELIIAISQHIKSHMLKNYTVDESKIRLIPRCVDIEKFSPSAVTQERIIRAISDNNLPEDRPIISLIGRITRWKGQHLLVEAMSKIKHKEAYALIIGSDQGRVKYTNELKETAEKLGVADRIQFIGESFDIPALLMVSDIVLSTAVEPEAFGRAAIEGQAMGKIVLASNIGGSLENVIDGVSGRLFQSGNAQDLAEAIDWALDLPAEKKKEISDAAIKNVHDHFTKQQMCDKTIAVYKELLKMNS